MNHVAFRSYKLLRLYCILSLMIPLQHVLSVFEDQGSLLFHSLISAPVYFILYYMYAQVYYTLLFDKDTIVVKTLFHTSRHAYNDLLEYVIVDFFPLKKMILVFKQKKYHFLAPSALKELESEIQRLLELKQGALPTKNE